MLDGTQAKYGDIMNDMNLMDELLKIPADATAATVQGIEMLLIDENKAGALLESDPNDNTILSNGRFLFQSDNTNLVALYKVTGASE
jgi:hypothetical protein